MTEKEEILSRARKKRFADNNGKVMRAFNVLKGHFKALTTVQAATELDMEESEFLDSIDFLVKAGYLELRTVRGKADVKRLDDTRWELLEGDLSVQGIRLSESDIKDGLVVM